MTHPEAPRFETRSAAEVVDYLARRLDLPADRSDAMGEGLLRVFGRYFEILAERLNRVPEKQHLAFLDLFGAKLAPPAPARVPLTFFPVKQLAQRDRAAPDSTGAQGPAFVPAFTQAAAALADGKDEAVVFETERALELTSALLKRVIARDPASDQIADYSDLAIGAAPAIRPFVDRMRPALHALYLRRPDELPPELSSLTVHFDIEPGVGRRKSNQVVEWSLPGEAEVVLTPSVDTTNGLTRSGEISFRGLPEWQKFKVNGVGACWLRCRLVSSLPCEPDEASGEASVNLPIIRGIAAAGSVDLANQLPEKAFFNGQALDVSAGFFPFGVRPRFGDVFYLGSSIFTHGDAQIVLAVQLANPQIEPPGPPPGASLLAERPRLIWEAPVAGRWTPLYCEDDTHDLTQSGTVRFRLPVGVGLATVNGAEGGWIRARFAGRSSASRESIEKILVAAAKQPSPQPEGLVVYAPAIESITLTISKTLPRCSVSRVLIADDFEVATATFPISFANEPFTLLDCGRKALYVGLEAQTEAIEDRTIAVHVFAGNPAGGAVSTADLLRKRAPTAGEYWSGDGWATIRTSDETNGFSAAGNVSLAFDPDACASSALDSRRLHWIRLLWPADETFPSPIERLALNTVWAVNAITSENELLGSSDDTPDQAFRCAHAPVLHDIRLEVREDRQFPSKELAHAPARAGEKVRLVGNVPDPGDGPWVRWTLVKDFIRSQPGDRHFVMEPISGKISFGNGIRGRIPPGGANNLRIRRYRYGGGSRGNVAANSITELRTTIPLVSGVTNFAAAVGGLDAERVGPAGVREGAWLRHRDRAVTRDDYEDLALAIPGVARAKCFPLRNLADDTDREPGFRGGVSVVIVPDSKEAGPQPTAAQLLAVHQFLSERSSPEIALTVVGPEYVSVQVDAELACRSDRFSADVSARCRASLSRYLHPLTGGPDGAGWPFGTHPSKTELSSLLQHVEGVAHVRSLFVHTTESRSELSSSDHYLVSSGEHRIACTTDAGGTEEV